ncbi:phage tail protein [Xenorhabdus sp. PR6a]|uniref:phage tail-collar fiber domain-containing protein n=1 Tax=Xenorhabdus sp. PR6a TaxID=3025877 RepID=UPI002358ED35|nr:phage tail protein [Xenorhabdus sp. PR6a]MDC9582401.1 phage tail protein [Xenorhabdus sp. PR6a]
MSLVAGLAIHLFIVDKVRVYMSTKYSALLTHAGTKKLGKAALSGIKLEITHMAVGDLVKWKPWRVMPMR